MFCYQCEQTAKGGGCAKIGVCGKQPEEAVLQDLLTKKLVGLSQAAVKARELGGDDMETGRLITRGPVRYRHQRELRSGQDGGTHPGDGHMHGTIGGQA